MGYQKCPCFMPADSQSPSVKCTVYLLLYAKTAWQFSLSRQWSGENLTATLHRKSCYLSPGLPWYFLLSFMEFSPISGLFLQENIWPTSYKKGSTQALETRAVRWVSRVLAMNFITRVWVRHLQMPRSMAFWSDCDPPCHPLGTTQGNCEPQQVMELHQGCSMLCVLHKYMDLQSHKQAGRAGQWRLWFTGQPFTAHGASSTAKPPGA